MYNNLEIIGSGGEGTVYKHNNEAIKIFNNKESEKISILLKDIKLKKIITPNKIIYENGIYKGYTMNYIKQNRNIKTITKEELIDNLKGLEKDLRKLTKNNIIARDFIPKNSLLNNNELYFIDTSLYSLSDLNIIELNKQNLNNIQYYLKSLIGYASGSLENRMKIYKLFNYKFNYLNDMKNNESIEDYAKRLVK